MSLDQVVMEVPSSTANCGPGYDIWAVGTKNPYLRVTCDRTGSGVEVECRSPLQPPKSRQLGYSGRMAAEHFLQEFGITQGVRILYEDSDGGYRVGGLGRSGAEIVGATLAVAIAYGKTLSREELTAFCFKIEGHPDNVAASINGNFNIMSASPYTGELVVDSYDLPESLGLAIGFSSHEKPGGTEAGRKVLQDPLEEQIRVSDLTHLTGSASLITAALLSGNTNRFLEFVWGDRFHEPRRAGINFYGPFNATDLEKLKRELYGEFHVGWCVSGAGPNMQAWYDKNEYPNGIVSAVSPLVAARFKEWGIEMRLKEMEIAREGAYGYAQRVYGYGKAVA